jgi:hypothetical protein
LWTLSPSAALKMEAPFSFKTSGIMCEST